MAKTNRVFVRSMHLIATINACDRLGVEGLRVIRVDSQWATVDMTAKQRAAIEACGYPVADDWQAAEKNEAAQ